MGKSLIMYGILIVYLLLSLTILTPANIPLFNVVFNPIIWILITLAACFFAKDEHLRVKNSQDKLQSILIIMIIYIIIYFGIGLFAGFQKTPYAKDLLSIIKNLWAFGGIIVFEEITRNAMIRINSKKTWNLIIVTVLFMLLQVNFMALIASYSSIQSGFTYTSSIIVPVVASNILLSYLSYIGGIKLPIIYRFVVGLPQFVVPIIPDLNWFITAVIGVTLPLIVYVYINYVHVKHVERLNKRRAKQYSPISYVPVFAILICVVLFVVGAFKYQPIAIMSGSMTPTFFKGDAVVVEKLSKTEKDSLKKGDIIQFASGGKYVIHRIIKVEKDEYENRIFITQGDYNNVQDRDPVNYEQVIGKYKFRIPFIGYPSLWLNEAME